MANRLFNFAAVVSAIMFCLVVAAWVGASAIDPRKQFVSLSNRCHVSIDARGADARLEIFNDSNYGPYTGSIVAVGDSQVAPKVSGIGDIAGVYYRIIRWPDGSSLWTLSLSLLYPLIFASLLPILWVTRRSGWRFSACSMTRPNDV